MKNICQKKLEHFFGQINSAKNNALSYVQTENVPDNTKMEDWGLESVITQLFLFFCFLLELKDTFPNRSDRH
jgi:hypothetical protein